MLVFIRLSFAIVFIFLHSVGGKLHYWPLILGAFSFGQWVVFSFAENFRTQWKRRRVFSTFTG